MTSIMIVEDEFIVAQDLVISLTAMGYDVCGIFETGESALQQVQQQRPDLVLMDIMLKGGLDGIQTSRKMHARSDVPIIFLTAFADQALVERAKTIGPFGYLLKPFTKKELQSAIEIGLYKAGMEKKLRASEKRFREMADLLPTVICEVDATGRITFINRSGTELFGLSKENIAQGVNLLEFLPEEEQTKAQERFKQVLNGKKLGSTEYRMRNKKGAELTLIVNSAPIRENGTVIGARISIVDITEIKKLQVKLRQAWKMEAIATLAGGIAHEFNNALTIIVAHADLLKLQQPDDATAKKYLANIMSSVDRMSGLTRQMLAYARGGRYYPRTASLNDFVQNALSLIRKSIDPAINIETELQDDVIVVEMDEKQFQFVLAALIANACEAMEAGGRIRVKTQNSCVDEALAGGNDGLKPGFYACLQVEDNGCGMDSRTRQRIFEPFYSTKFTGRGLGMAAVYGIIKNHGGWTGVDSKPNEGTVVTIYLPEIKSR